MYLSRYLKSWPYHDEPGYTLLYSTKKSSLVLLPDEIIPQLKLGRCPAEYVDDLAELGMLVPDPAKEKEELCRFIPEINRLNPGIDISVILGLDCNFACTYCYEGSMKGKAAMTDETADRLVDFVRGLVRPGKEKLTLDFYGGEPLLYTKQIKRIAGALQPFARAKGIDFRFSLVTNGSLLTRGTVESLLPFGLKGAKVTVDGPPAIHDRCRPFKSGKPSFDIIMRNIRDCCDLVKIGLGGNFTRYNFKEFPRLFEHLAEYELTPEHIRQIQFSPASQTSDKYANPEFAGGCRSCAEPWLAEAANLLREETMKRQFKAPKMGLAPCMVDVNDAYTVHFDGNLFKCVAMIGHPHYAVGDIRQGVKDYQDIYHVDHWRHSEECLDCAYLPLCFGGCRYMEYQRSGDMAAVDCMREFFDASLEVTIKQEVKYRHNAV